LVSTELIISEWLPSEEVPDLCEGSHPGQISSFSAPSRSRVPEHSPRQAA
jgi:hypothetical protein